MAYFPYNAARPAPQPVSGLGSYFAWGSNAELYRPVNGLAGGTEEQKLADDAARARIEGRRPLAVVSEWATQVTDISWQEVRGVSAITVLPLRDGDAAAVKREAFGNELPLVAVFGTKEAPLEVARAAFSNTPYRLTAVLAVYALDDAGAIARARYLWLATPRSPLDKDGGSGSLEEAARKLRGTLCYLVSLPKPPGGREPGAPFEAVRALELGAAAAEDAALPPPPPGPQISHYAWLVGGMAVAGGVWFLLTRRGA